MGLRGQEPLAGWHDQRPLLHRPRPHRRPSGGALDGLITNYSRKANWRNYSWVIDGDAQATALMQLCHVGLQFDEGRSNNSFAYATTCTANVFKRYIGQEHNQRAIRDDILIQAGCSPSLSRQVSNTMADE